MKSLWLTVMTVSLTLTAFGQGQPKMVPVPANATMELPNFLMHAPSGEGWRVTNPDENAAEIRFENSQLRAEIAVEDKKLANPVPNVEEKLAQLSQAIEKQFSQHGKLILSEHAVETRPGAQCLYQRIIINSPELTAPGLPPGNVAVHALECIYGPDHQGMATFRYMYPTQGSADEQKKVVQEFFAGINFKLPPAKQTFRQN
jgi:hypothetical protein